MVTSLMEALHLHTLLVTRRIRYYSLSFWFVDVLCNLERGTHSESYCEVERLLEGFGLWVQHRTVL